MTSWWTIACACAVFATGGVHASEEPTLVIPELGENLPLRLRTDFDTVVECNLVTPKNETITFKPEPSTTDKFEFMASLIPNGCRVNIRNVDENDNGIWHLYYNGQRIQDNTTVPTSGSQYYRVIVHSEATEAPSSTTAPESEQSEEEEDPIETTWLPAILYGARIGVNISITISNRNLTEECYLRTPQRTVRRLEDDQIEGIRGYTRSSDFVSCRAVIGPMSELLIGNWSLCGRHLEEGILRQRCQNATIFWAISNPAEDWNERPVPNLEYPVHFGGRQSAIVRGSGTLNTCHVVTPNGEDIVVTAQSDYPGLAFVPHRDTTVCSVVIDPITTNFIGNWELYGTYNSFAGFNIVRQPLTFFLFDEENPYDQAHNVTNMTSTTYFVNMGNLFNVEFSGSGTRDRCFLITNTGKRVYNVTTAAVDGVIFVPNSNSDCRVRVGPITKDLLGNWTVVGRFRRNGMFNEMRQPFTIVLEDPANPIPDDTREIEYMRGQDIYTWFSASHEISWHAGKRETTDSCHLRTPDNLQFRLNDGFNMSGVSINRRVSCGVIVRIESEDIIGEWMLISRFHTRHGHRIERRLPFTIHVEDYVMAWPKESTVAEGNDLYLRLQNPTTLPNTCALEGPSRNIGEVDKSYPNYCGFIVRSMTVADSGQWNVTYGDRVKHKAFVQVTVTARPTNPDQHIIWSKDDTINQTIGPEDTVYCKIENPHGLTIFEAFGRCHIVLDRVTSHHDGVWKMTVGTTGRVLTETYDFVVTVTKAAPRAEVMTSVEANKPNVMITCGAPTQEPVTACKFRDPSGRVLLASQGVGEDRYTFHGVGVSIESNVSAHQCGLRISNPVVADLGLWRCAVDTHAATYYGFLTVLCPFALLDPQTAALVVTEPTLIPETAEVSAVEGDDVTMQCSVNAPIRYCYFRRQNGTIFSVNPASNVGFEYVGAGFEAGECGVRFPSLLAADSGRWSCHVGFFNSSIAEQRARFDVIVEAMMETRQYHLPNTRDTLVIEAQVHTQRALEYCRFVRMDGYGFTLDNLLPGYVSHSELSAGRCVIRVDHPSILERHPWVVAARIQGQELEIVRTTTSTFQPVTVVTTYSNFVMVWTCVLIISLALFFAGIMLGPKKNRSWTYQRAAAVRNSFRKTPLIYQNNTTSAPTPIAA